MPLRERVVVRPFTGSEDRAGAIVPHIALQNLVVENVKHCQSMDGDCPNQGRLMVAVRERPLQISRSLLKARPYPKGGWKMSVAIFDFILRETAVGAAVGATATMGTTDETPFLHSVLPVPS